MIESARAPAKWRRADDWFTMRNLLVLIFLFVVFMWLSRVFRQLGAGGSGPHQRRFPGGNVAPEKHHARVLGLNGDVSPENIKRLYRQLIAKYHPDKVQHLGQEFQRLAESKTREINEAYDYFSRKLRF